MWIIAMIERLGQALKDPTIQVARNRAYGRRTAAPLMDSILTHLLHVVRLYPDPANGVVDPLLSSRSKVQVLMLGWKGYNSFKASMIVATSQSTVQWMT
jgi:hypothetical protein